MRVLLITRHYPPAVSGGAKRPFLVTQALRELGVDVFVVAPTLPDGEQGLAVRHPHRDPSTAPRGPRSLRDFARELLLWPDPDIGWSRRAARAASPPWRPDWIWTTSPPESVHAAGALLKRRLGARWVADFRDHWLDRPHRKERQAPLRRIGEKMLARAWLRQADVVTCVDEHIAAELATYGARAPHVAPHFSPADATARVTLPPGDVNVVHTGSIALSDPDARIDDLLAAFASALTENPDLRLHLVGRLTHFERAAVHASPAQSRIVAHGVVSFEESLAFQRAADALALVGSPKSRVPPSKITEYMAADAPILAFGEGQWRRDPRLDAADPLSVLAALRKGMTRTPLLRAPGVREVAADLLALLKIG